MEHNWLQRYAMDQGLDVYKKFGVQLPYYKDYDNTNDDSDNKIIQILEQLN